MKKTRHVIVTVALSALVGIATAGSAFAQPGPLDVSGEINGAPYRIVVPADWNGTLLVFQRGWTDKADHPGEIDNRNPTITPNATVRDALLAEGYALAGSARKSNGFSVEEGLDDVVALVSHFRENVANPAVAILWGVSVGGVITLETAERNGGAFDGYLAIVPGGAGAPRHGDVWLVLRLAYDVTFGMPGSWGTPGDVRDDLDYESEVLPILTAQASDPANFGRFEFVRLMAGIIPGPGITTPPGYFPSQLIGLTFALVTEFWAELERRAGGPVVQNINHFYSLTGEEKAYLAGLGVDADPLLEAMNARRNIAASPEHRNYIEHFADYSGHIKNPVLTLHTALDEIALVSGQSAYRNTIEAAGRGDLLFQAYTTGIGHGTAITAGQQLTAIHAIEAWAKTGIPPTSATFPAALGFNPGYEPPAWPQP
jgi:pimeloyl-ACP methyl ester carboxylesterase